jgi:hypothetical protein
MTTKTRSKKSSNQSARRRSCSGSVTPRHYCQLRRDRLMHA